MRWMTESLKNILVMTVVLLGKYWAQRSNSQFDTRDSDVLQGRLVLSSASLEELEIPAKTTHKCTS
jgi:hypothetical protein